MKSAFSTISESRRASLLEGNDPVPVDFTLHGGLFRRLWNNVHPAAEHLFQALFQIVKKAEIGKSARGAGWVELYRYIDIGGFAFLVAGRGPNKEMLSTPSFRSSAS